MSDGCYLDLELRHADQACLVRALEMLKKDESFVEATGPDRRIRTGQVQLGRIA
jgi:hypothetical protein